MSINFKKFYRACNPSITLNYSNADDRKYYIDFTKIRSGNLIRELKRTITLSDDPTSQLFTGHLGCGKSTELLRLKAELEDHDYHVVYFVSSDELDMGDLDITDILLVIARKISENLIQSGIKIKAGYFKRLFGEIKHLLTNDIDISPEIEFSMGLAKITAKTKDSPKLRNKLRDYLEPRTKNILESINNEVLKVANQKLKETGKKGLVVIVDNLDRIDNKPNASGRTQPEYIFIDRGDQLKQLNCHVVFTIPLTLIFSNDSSMLNSRFGVKPKLLSMIPILSRTGEENEQGMYYLKQMILARAFPEIPSEERNDRILEIFKEEHLMNKICHMSGGHVRNLLGLLFSCIQKEDPPFSEEIVDEVIQEYRDDMIKKITSDEWMLLKQVVKDQNVSGETAYHTLLRSMFVFEYQDKKGVWFGLNPLIEKSDQLNVK